MIEPHAPAPPGAPPPWAGPARLPVRQRTGRFLVLACVFVCAACGLVYELELVALASYLIGDSVTQASVVLSVMVFAMGIGSLAAKRLRRLAAAAFGAIEALLALVGGCSAMALYAVFAWTGDWGGPWASGPRWLLVAFSLAIGLLIGAEVPLLMELIQRIRRQDAGGAVADLFAADYVGALVGGLAFPFLLLPQLGQLTGAMLTGAINAVAGAALVLGLFRRDLSRRARWLLPATYLAVLGVLATAAVLVDDFERAAREAVYGADVRVALQTGVQEVVLTGGTGGRPLDLFLDGRLRVSGRDEYRYHEALVQPAMDGPHARVLVLGGGDGLAAREVLRYPGVRRVDVVELDPAVVDLARADPALSRLNGHVYGDPRVHVTIADAFRRLRTAPPVPSYDVVIADLPDPGITASTKLYSEEFYGLVRRVLTPDGRLVVHAGPVASRPRVFWTVEATLRAAGLHTTPYRVTGGDSGSAAGPDRTPRASRAPGDWGFVLAARGRGSVVGAVAGSGSGSGVGVVGSGADGAGAVGPWVAGSGVDGTGRIGSGAGGSWVAGSGVTGSAMTGPGMVGPEVAGSGMVGPGVAGPGVVGPGVAGSGMTGPGMVGPGAVGPGVAGSGMTGPGMVGPEVAGPGVVAGPGMTGPGVDGPGAAGAGDGGPGVTRPKVTGPGVTRSGPTGPGGTGQWVTPPGTLTEQFLRAAERAAEATRIRGLAASTLVHPRY